jgi:hypothetical protein
MVYNKNRVFGRGRTRHSARLNTKGGGEVDSDLMLSEVGVIRISCVCVCVNEIYIVGLLRSPKSLNSRS